MRNGKQFAAVMAVFMAAGMTFSAAAADTAFSIDMEGGNPNAWKNVAVTNDDTVTTGALIRQGADTDEKVVGYLYRGGAVNVLWKGENWSEVESGGVHGYIDNDCLVFGNDAKGLAEHYGQYAAEASWNDVHILAEGDANAKILETAGDGDTYPLICKDGHWVEVKTQGKKTAFVSEDDVDIVLLMDTAVDVNGQRTSVKAQAASAEASAPAQSAQQSSYETASDYTEPSYQETAYEEPSYQEPAYQEPAYQEPAYQEPAYQEPAYQEPTYQETAASPADDGSSGYTDDTQYTDDGAEEFFDPEPSDDSQTWDGTADDSYDDSGDGTDSWDDTQDTDWDDPSSNDQDVYDDGAADEYYDDSAADDYIDDTYADENFDEYYDDGSSDETSYDDGSYDDGAYDDGYYDDGTYDDGSYDDGTYDDGTYDDGYYDDGTYDDGTYDDGSYDDGSYDDSSSASSSDLDLLAAIIYHEAGNQPTEGKIAVGAVVLNRVYSGSFPNTISEVLYQPGQFTPAGELAGTIASGVPSDCYDAANAALAGQDPTGGCLYFNTSHGSGVHIGDHWFY